MNIRKLSVLLLALALIFSFAGCSAGNQAAKSENYAADGNLNYSYRTEAAGDTAYEEKPAEGGKEEAPALPDNRKLIQSVRMTVEVQELGGAIEELESRIADYGGYVESSDIYNGSSSSSRYSRNASITVRIPADRLESFLTVVSGVSNVVSSSKSVEDVTLSYVSTESRMNALKTEEARLLELLAKAETMDDLLTIESRLTSVRTEIEQIGSTLRVYDNQVEYATIHLSISEVRQFTDTKEPETVWERIGKGFTASVSSLWNGIVELFVWFTVNIVYIVLYGTILAVIIVLIRRQKKKRAAKKPPQQEN